ncbi:MAG: hypothetical protein GC201_08040 [Alphaproteobacteria bacterium]|nr:hypothetical protein [Alphaproteobacteria bacterium]
MIAWGLAAGPPSAAQTNPWEALPGGVSEKGDTKASFEGDNQTTGSYSHKIAVYKLDETTESGDEADTDYDWYRIDMRIEAAISRYRKGESVCGWWTDKVRGAVKVSTSGAKIWEYAPDASGGSTTKTKEMGYKIGASGLRFDYGYSVSQTADSLGIKVDYAPTSAAIAWIANLDGCNKVGDAFSYSGASKIARTTFVLNPSVIVRVPQGSKLVFRTNAQKQTNGFVQAKQRRDNGAKRKSFDFDYELTCTATKCTAAKKG